MIMEPVGAAPAGPAVARPNLLAFPTPTTTRYRFITYVTIAAAVGWVAAFGLALLRPRTGLALGMVVLPVAVATTMAGFFALNAALGGGLDEMLVTTALLGPTVAGFFLLLLAAPVLRFVTARDRVRRVWAATTPAALAAALLVLGTGSDVGAVARGFAEPSLDPDVAMADYQLVLGNLVQRHEQVREGFGAVLSDPTPDDQRLARRLRAEVIPLADSLLADARAYRPPTPQIERAHGPAVDTVAAAQESMSWLATALETGDTDLLARAQARWSEHLQAFERWTAAVAELPLDR